jgi:hypothetical protein
LRPMNPDPPAIKTRMELTSKKSHVADAAAAAVLCPSHRGLAPLGSTRRNILMDARCQRQAA